MERYLNPNTFIWDGQMADYKPESDDIPFGLVPEKKITIDEIKYVLSSYYQGTDYNPYSNHADKSKQGMYRPIGINRNNFVAITQLRHYLPSEIMAIEWIAVGSNAFNTIVPFYSNVLSTPEYLSNTTSRVTTENFYWINRIIGALADSHYGSCIAEIERYQLKSMAYCQNMIQQFDQYYLANKVENVQQYLTECNQKIMDYIQKSTDKLLAIILDKASNEMKNSFSRSDN